MGLLTAAAWFLAVGCDLNVEGDGQNAYTMASPYPKNVKSVWVPIFTRSKDVYRHNLEDRLTEAVQKAIEKYTPYKLAARSRADTELIGSIDEVIQGILAFNPDTGNPFEKEVTINISFTWTDLRDGETIKEQKNFGVTGIYIPDPPLGEIFFEGSQDVIEKAAVRIVEHMEAEW